MNTVKDDIKATVTQSIRSLFPGFQEPVTINPAPNRELGDYSFAAFPIGNKLGRNVEQVAKDLSEKIGSHWIHRSKCVGPFINICLKKQKCGDHILRKVFAEKGNYGSSQAGNGKKIVIDFSHPNIAKPFHVGHLRSTNIGADISRILAFRGYDVVRKNYLGDWGTQFGFVIHGLMNYGDEVDLQTEPIHHLVALYIRANKDAENDDSVREKARDIFRRLEQGDPEIVKQWRMIRSISIEAFKKTYQRLNIQFDSYDGEASIVKQLPKVIQRFRDAGLVTESKGAQVVELPGLNPLMLLKSDGSTTYATRDLGEAIHRFERYQFHANLYVVARQDYHFQQVFAALNLLAQKEEWEDNWTSRCEVISFGFVKGMSTRKGNVVWLSEFLDEGARRARLKQKAREHRQPVNDRDVPDNDSSEAIGKAAILFSDVSATRNRDVDFSWEKSLQFEGFTGPYIQYSFARAFRILEKSEVKLDDSDSRISNELSDSEWDLILKMDAFSDAVEKADITREPHEIAKYLFELANTFNSFYANCPVLRLENPDLMRQRIQLVRAFKQVLENGMGLLGLTPVSSM